MLNYEKRKVSFLTELLDLRDNTLEVEEFTKDEITEILTFLCINWYLALSFNHVNPVCYGVSIIMHYHIVYLTSKTFYFASG